VAIMPWRLLSDYGTYIFGWLVGYSGLLGPIAGIFIADYWLIRRTNLSLPDLYREDGIYGRWNPKALVALAAGVAIALIGLVVPGLRVLYDYAWFVGFAVAFVLYWTLMIGTPQVDLSRITE
jgi:nucleobase:cation symporter-1, NCS1 family